MLLENTDNTELAGQAPLILYQIANPTSYFRDSFLSGITSGKTLPQPWCMIHFADDKPSPVGCKNVGPISLSGSTKDWNGFSTMVYVPEGWVAIGQYQRWDGENDWALVEEDQGYFQLKTGMNNLRTERFELYHDQRLNNYFRTMRPDEETNDKLQGIYIFQVTHGVESLSVWEHEDMTKGRRLDFALASMD